MIITLTGLPCTGKSSIASMLAKHYSFAYHNAGDMRRTLAAKRGLTLGEYNNLAEDTDTPIEEFQKNLGKTQDNFIMEGRLAAWCIPQGISIFLTARPEVRAERARIADPHHERIAESFIDDKDAAATLEARTKSDKERFLRHYNFDPFEATNYDIVIDTSDLNKDEVFAKIIEQIERIRASRESVMNSKINK